MSCQIGALGEREVHSIGEQLTSISGSMFSPEQIIKLYGCVPTRFLLREALNKDCCAPASMPRWPAPSNVLFLPDYRDWPRCALHSPRAERMRENIPVTPSA